VPDKVREAYLRIARDDDTGVNRGVARQVLYLEPQRDINRNGGDEVVEENQWSVGRVGR
jgi:hypothetical protein